MQHLLAIDAIIKQHVAQVTGSNATGFYAAEVALYAVAVLLMLAVYGLIRPAGGKQ